MRLNPPAGVKILVAVLFLQAVGFHAISRDEQLPTIRPLADLPSEIGPWRLHREGVVEDRVQDVLQADDVVNRIYQREDLAPAGLFIAYFKTQRSGKAPHSPRNCLPGSGWVPTESAIVPMRVPGRPEPVSVNRYLVERGGSQSVVLYWYQSRDRVVASEYWAKIYLVLDSLRENRSDTALVRVTVPVEAEDVEQAAVTAEQFAVLLFAELPRFPQFRSGPAAGETARL